MSLRTRERIKRLEPDHQIINGEFIDQFTSFALTPQRLLELAEESLNRLPKCCRRLARRRAKQAAAMAKEELGEENEIKSTHPL